MEIMVSYDDCFEREMSGGVHIPRDMDFTGCGERQSMWI